MGDITTQIIATSFAVIPSFVGIIIDNLKSRGHSRELIRAVEVCEMVIIEQVSIHLSAITTHFKKEISRILLLAFRNLEVTNIDSMEIEAFNYNFDRTAFKVIRQANKHIKQLESAHIRILIFRWLFWIILLTAILLTLVVIVWPNVFSSSFIVPISAFSVLAIVAFLLDRVVSSNLLDEVQKEHGISV